MFFSELKKKLGHNFDVENSELSISEVFRAIPALYREIDANMCHQNSVQKKLHLSAIKKITAMFFSMSL